MREDMIQLTKEMVKIASVNTTQGEQAIGEYLEAKIRSIPYFEKHPEQVIVQELKEDKLHRRNVIALLLGEKDTNGNTLLLHGHTDTVGLEGYGALEPYAFDPDKLEKHLQEVELPKEVEEDLLSGEYMFGRGSCDMKSGVAVFLGILMDACRHPEELSGNLLVSFNPVEENLHTGIIEATDVFLMLMEKYHLRYILGINNDYTCPLYEGDTTKTIYTGMGGKLLPCFYIQGKETHVGQCFEGLDASLIAAKLVDKIHLNTEFSDGWDSEYTYPPCVLKMKDLKPWYNVQTAPEALVYFNYFVHHSTIEEITEKLVAAGQQVFQEVLTKIQKEIDSFAQLSGQTAGEIHYNCQVLSYQELYRRAACMEDFKPERMGEILAEEEEKGCDKREIPIAMIRYLLQVTGITSPTMVLYYAAPYCPHNTLQGENEHLRQEIKAITREITKATGATYRMMHFYQSLSDSSYLNMDDPMSSVEALIENFPGYEQLYPVPLENIKKLAIPAVNYGVFGKDAHKWTERVYMPYTFEVLPQLIQKTIDYYLK